MKKHLLLIVLFLLSLLPLVDLLKPGLPVTHDGKDHVARIANFYQNLEEGVIIPRWAGNLNWGYGHPVLLFLYPLPSYFASLFHLIGFSFVDSLKIAFASAYILSGLTMFIFLKKLFNIKAAFLGSLLYLYAPYRFVDIYVRGAIGEHVAFIFPPLIAYFMCRLQKENKKYLILLASLSLAGLILSHNAISLMFLPLLTFFGIYLILTVKDKKTLFLRFLLFLILGFTLSAFFWVPALFEGKYTLRDIVTVLDFRDRLYPLSSFIYSPWGYGISGEFSLQIGIFHILSMIACLILGIISLVQKRRKEGVFLTSLFLTSFLIILLMTPIAFPIWDSVSLLQKFQFPWRFLTVLVFLTSFMGVLVFRKIPNKFQVACIAIVTLGLILQSSYYKVKSTKVRPASYYTGIYESTTDTGESSPLWSTRFMEKRFQKPIELIGGKGEVVAQKRTSTSHSYSVDALDTVQFVENTVYFPGWSVYIDGVKSEVIYQNMIHRGLLTFTVPKGRHQVEVIFSNTKLRFLADMLTVTGIIFLILFTIFEKNKFINRFLKMKNI